MQLQTRMVQDEASHTFLIEQTFWNAQNYYLNHRGGREFLKEHVCVGCLGQTNAVSLPFDL